MTEVPPSTSLSWKASPVWTPTAGCGECQALSSLPGALMTVTGLAPHSAILVGLRAACLAARTVPVALGHGGVGEDLVSVTACGRHWLPRRNTSGNPLDLSRPGVPEATGRSGGEEGRPRAADPLGGSPRRA